MEPQASPTITAKSQKMMEMLMMEPKVAEKVADGYTHKIITIYRDGTVVLGKTPYYWWNNLIKCQKVINFPIFALAVWNALLELSDGEARMAIKKGLSQEIIEKAIHEKKYDEIIDRLIDVSRHACGPNVLRSVVSPNISNADNTEYEQNRETDISVNINGVKKKLKLVDSIGDPLIDIYLEPTSYSVRYGR